jgi:hypothetical protein
MNDTTNGDGKKFDVEKRILQARQVDARIKEIEERHEEELKPFKELRERLRGTLLQWLKDTKQQNSKTREGTIYKSPRITYRVADQSQFREHILAHAAWGMVYWGKAISAGVVDESTKLVAELGYASIESWQVAQWEKLHPDQKFDPDDAPAPPVPPGIDYHREIILGLRAPPKPKTEGAQTAPEEGAPLADLNGIEKL